MMQVIRKWYMIDWVRIPVKVIFTFATIKVGYDYYQYRTAWRNRGPMPRCLTFNEQSPAEPLIPRPYMHYTTYEQYMNNKLYMGLQNNLIKTANTVIDRYFVLADSPARENVNSIDRFFMRGKEHVTSEVGKFYFLGELAKLEGSVPQGVYQQIRKTREQQVQGEAPLVPKL